MCEKNHHERATEGTILGESRWSKAEQHRPVELTAAPPPSRAAAGRALSYAPRLVLAPPLLGTLLDGALAGMLVQHREACCSVLAFVVRLLDPATHRKCPPEALGHLQQVRGGAG